MQNTITMILSGIGALIFIYLVAVNADKVSTLTNALASGSGIVIKDLQGR